MNPQINDVNIQIATVNGTGSQSANLILMRSIFNMGIPVAAKNLFPSNIAGLPTWYTIRAHHKGYQASKKENDIVVLMNTDTVYSDIRGLRPGAVVIHDTGMKLDHALREDHINYGVPFTALVNKATDNVKLKKKVVNMIYVGVLAHLLNLDAAAIDKAVRKQFGKKEKVVELNANAIEVGRAWAAENLEKKDPFQLQTMNATADKILIEGNTASALGALMGGCTFLSWYPITPSSSVCESLIGYFEKFRHDPVTGHNRYAAIQAEDEIAALGMVIGAGWAGARAMTATSGPGISLMAELTGYGYFTEIPAVIVNVQRMGPSTGLPTRNSQGDLLSTYYLSHGDTQHPLLFPSSMDECYEMGQQAFDLAEQMQTPVFVMSELDLGMNTWMTKPFKYPDQPYARGKVLNAEALEKVESFGRYADVDGDGIPYRTLPGTRNEKAPYFTRGSGHNAQAKYSEDAGDWEAGMERIARKFEGAQQWLPAPVLTLAEKPSEIGLIHFGSTRWPMEEALDLFAEQGFQPDSLRIRSLPAHAEVEEFIAKHTHCYVVEQNRDGQMRSILAATFPDLAPRLRSICHFNGSFLDANTIVSAVLKLEKGSELAHV